MSFHLIKELPSQEELREMFDYKPETGKLFRKPLTDAHFSNIQDSRGASWAANNYNSQFAGKEAFTSTDSRGYKTGKIHNVNYQAHRVVWKIVHGTDPLLIDHINGEKTDNRDSNLRDCTNADNCRNYSKPDGSSSKYRGVCWVKRDQKWAARISNGSGGKRSLGNFSDEVMAARAYDAAARELHGSFATLNFPQET